LLSGHCHDGAHTASNLVYQLTFRVFRLIYLRIFVC